MDDQNIITSNSDIEFDPDSLISDKIGVYKENTEEKDTPVIQNLTNHIRWDGAMEVYAKGSLAEVYKYKAKSISTISRLSKENNLTYVRYIFIVDCTVDDFIYLATKNKFDHIVLVSTNSEREKIKIHVGDFTCKINNNGMTELHAVSKFL